MSRRHCGSPEGHGCLTQAGVECRDLCWGARCTDCSRPVDGDPAVMKSSTSIGANWVF